MSYRYHIFLLLFLTLWGIGAFCQGNIEFVENKGQWDSRVSFMGQAGNGAFFIHRNGFTVLQHNAEDVEMLHELYHLRTFKGKKLSRDLQLTLRSHAYRVSFVNANFKAIQVVPDKPLETYDNYFIGNDPSKWASHCRIFQGVTVSNIYPNVDVRYYSDAGVMKYDFIVHPGGNVSDIALKYEGADHLVMKNRDLVIGTSVGDNRELAPFTYQPTEEGRQQVDAKFSLKDNIVHFIVRDYDKSKTLVIDPALIFCSFTGSAADNWGFTATYGPDGSMFGGGIVFGQGFPVSPGAFQTAFGGGRLGGFGSGFDIGIIKLSSDGTKRLFATYLGGDGNDFPQSLITDPQGELIVAGRSDSPNFPGTLIGSGGSFDIILTKFNVNGTAIIGSTKIGGAGDDGANITAYGTGATSLQRNYGDEARSEVNLDGAGNIYLASCTQSDTFPIVNGFQTVKKGAQDGVVLKLTPDLSTLLFSTYLGGSGNDAAYVLSIDPLNSNIYVAGGTESADMPGTPPGASNPPGNIGPASHGSIDGFVSIISNNGSTLIKTAYIGTGAIDQIYGIQFDKSGFPYIMGQTMGTWTIVNATWSQPNGKQFICKLKPDLSAFVYATVFGKGLRDPDISPVAFLVDRCENVYLSGWGGIVNPAYPSAGVSGLPITAGAIKRTPDVQDGLGSDFYFFVLKKDASAQLYGSFFGQNGPLVDHVDGGTSRFDKNGVIYQAICANCNRQVPFPTTPGVWAPTNGAVNSGAQCNLAMVKIAFDLSGVRGHIQSSINGHVRDTTGCVPLTVDFRDTIQVAKSYDWNFGDGSAVQHTTAPTVSHTYNSTGVFQVMMIAIDSATCNIRDTSYLNIKVGDQKALIDFTPVKLNPCDQFKYRFDNVSVAPGSLPFAGQTFVWDFGDQTPRVPAGTESVFHTYASPGTYTVKLILSDDRYCNSPDSVVKTLRVAALVQAKFLTPPNGCAPYTAQFDNQSAGGEQFTWNFGDGTTSNDVNPSHLYQSTGTYTISLVAYDSATCNKIDSTSQTITVYGKPTADFTATPQPPVKNTPISFANLSSPDAIGFKWSFGDGDTLTTTTRDLVQHEYNVTGTFQACLIAFNPAGCADTACKTVTTLVVPAVDVPNAFTPLSGGINSVVYVRGYGIAKMKFSIYARWGEKVFETADKHIGWDGRFKGQMLPMDVYAYTLEVQFTNGTRTVKKGDITLIR